MRTEDLTLEHLYARTIEVGECLEWTGYCSEGKFPQWRVDKRLEPARRIVWRLTRARDAGSLQVGVTCGNPLCVHPDHLTARTKNRALKGRWHNPLTSVKQALAARRGSRLTLEIAREIRMSDEDNAVLDARYGMSRGYASRIKTGRVWREYSTPFAGLGAR